MQTVIFLQSVYYLYFIQIYNSFCLIFCFSVYRADHERYKAFFLLQDRQKLQVLPIRFFRFFIFYIVKNLTYEQLFIWTTIHMFSYNIWHYVQKYILNLCNITNTEKLHCCRSYPSYHPDPIPTQCQQPYTILQPYHI